MHKKVVVIVGTNASGKSGLAVTLAKKFDGEVISADSRQVYKGLDIATGKVTEEEMGGIPHHLIDVADPKERYTAADFARDGSKALKDIVSRGKLPIVAGGTGFYIDTLLNPSILAAAPPNESLRAELEKSPTEELLEQLRNLDPERARDIEGKGEASLKRRIVRAIEVTLTAQEHHEELPPGKLFEILWIGIRWDDADLRKRIHNRLLARMEIGMVAETEALHTHGLSWERMDELGLEYRYLGHLLQGQCSEKEMLEQLETQIWRYAKRQRTWFKRNKRINWFDGDKLEGVEKLVESFLTTKYLPIR
jgi:tRNA dimethylallyltransferase